MAESYREQAILDAVETNVSGNGYSHTTLELTVTATMGNGSMLVGTTEAAAADAATVDGIIDDAKFGSGFPDYEVGSVIPVRVATGHCIANVDVIKFSDAAYAGEDLTVLAANGVKFQTADSVFTRI